MNKIRRVLVLLSLVLLAGPEVMLGEKVLLPVIVPREPLPGGYGSNWVTRITLTNVGKANLRVGNISNRCRFPGCPNPLLAPGTTVFAIPNFGERRPGEVPGTFLSVDGDAADLKVTLRFQDLSRAALTWGTTVSAVPASKAFSGRLSLIDIPADSRFRVLIRVYDFEPAPGHFARVRLYGLDETKRLPEESFERSDVFLGELTLALKVPFDFWDPGYAQFYLTDVPGVPGEGRLRVEIEGSENFKFWAFASVVNNETQHMTVVEP